MMRWNSSITGVLACASLLLAACGGAAAPAAPAAPQATSAPPATGATPAPAQPAGAQKSTKDTLTIVFQANQGTLDPHFAATNQEMLIIRNIYNGLLKYKTGRNHNNTGSPPNHETADQA